MPIANGPEGCIWFHRRLHCQGICQWVLFIYRSVLWMIIISKLISGGYTKSGRGSCWGEYTGKVPVLFEYGANKTKVNDYPGTLIVHRYSSLPISWIVVILRREFVLMVLAASLIRKMTKVMEVWQRAARSLKQVILKLIKPEFNIYFSGANVFSTKYSKSLALLAWAFSQPINAVVKVSSSHTIGIQP